MGEDGSKGDRAGQQPPDSCPEFGSGFDPAFGPGSDPGFDPAFDPAFDTGSGSQTDDAAVAEYVAQLQKNTKPRAPGKPRGPVPGARALFFLALRHGITPRKIHREATGKSLGPRRKKTPERRPQDPSLAPLPELEINVNK